MRHLVFPVVLASSCSFLSVCQPPAHPDPARPVRCTRERSAPWADAALSAIFFAILISTQCPPEQCEVDDFVGLGAALLTAPYAVSAMYGFGVTGDCAALQDRERR